ncbi:YeeE/YedE family protein [Stieleria sp.]|uniref:YeeE/YedE family protein n=1 Tax=Stieleria sp. TaxID=2795976 RepID=UPI003565779B
MSTTTEKPSDTPANDTTAHDTTTPHAENDHNKQPKPLPAAHRSLALGVLFGVVFGFLLQKGGVAKFHVLIGQLLLEDFTVVKVMLSAVVVGMLGIHAMHRANMVEFHIKPTRLASNVIGGLLFGCGFALSAYCPGTGAAALGQGNFDAIAMVVGMIAGSYVFAEASGWISRHLDPIGDKGKLTLFDLFPQSRTVVTLSSASLLVIVLIVLELTTTR